MSASKGKIKTLCLRCPEDKAPSCPAGKKAKDLSTCIATDGNCFPGFSDDHDIPDPFDLSSQTECRNLFKQLTEEEAANLLDAKLLEPSNIYGFMKQKRAGSTYNGKPLSKRILNAAYQTLWPRADVIPQSDVADTLQNVSLDDSAVTDFSNHAPRPARSGISPGTGKLVTNHFAITLQPGQVLYEYQFQGLYDPNDPDPLSPQKKKVLIKRYLQDTSTQISQRINSFAFNNEGKIISWQPLYSNAVPGQQFDVKGVSDYNRSSANQVSRTFTIYVEFKRTFDFQGLSGYVNGTNRTYEERGAAEALDILFSKSVSDNSNNSTVQVAGNRFFDLSTTSQDLSGDYGLEARRGFSSNVTPANGSVTLNVNTSFSAFFKSQTVLDYIDDLGGDQAFLRQKKLQSHLKNLRVRIMYDRTKDNETDRSKDSEDRRTKTITGFSKEAASDIKFRDRNGKPTTAWKHFVDDYGRRHSIASRGEKRICVNTGSSTNPCWFLADQLLVLHGQIHSGTLDKLDRRLVDDMISFACRPPHENRDAINSNGLAALGLGSSATPAVLQNAGIVVNRQMMQLPFSQLPRPKVTYIGGIDAGITAKHEWATNGKIFYTSDWRSLSGRIAFFAPRVITAKDRGGAYIEGFDIAAEKNGIKRDKKTLENCLEVPDFSIPSLVQKTQQAGLAVLVLPHHKSEYRSDYANFRIAADQCLGKPSIVLSEERLLKAAGAKSPGDAKPGRMVPYMANNMMKINVRLGNENHRVSNAFGVLQSGQKCDTLVLGADLIHPKQSNSEDVPSIASVVGSIDGNFATFYGSSRRTQHGAEIIDSENMEAMVKERIQAWRDSNKKEMPRRILYYRDGTGQSQYADIRQTEIEAIRKAWNALSPKSNKTPLQLTAVVVVKRHNTRFYPADGQPEFRGNCIPGTLVETGITSPYYFDFFLQSHTVQEGSAKPTHYFVLENGMKFERDQLQNLTNAFCYNFSHCTTSVSYASPAYFADKLCERVSLYLYRWYEGDTEDVSADKRQEEMDKDWNRGKQSGNPWHKNLNKVMFWM